MILDDKYINEDQITKIEYRGEYSNNILPPIYKVSNYKFFIIISNGSSSYYIELLAKNGTFINMDINSCRKIYESEKEFSDLQKKIKDNLIETVPDNGLNKKGFIKAYIELSSGTTFEYMVEKFSIQKQYDFDKQKYTTKSFGSEFNEEDINIDYVYKKVFSGCNNSKYEKKKVII